MVRSAVRVDWLERLLLLCEIREEVEPLSFVWDRMRANNHLLSKDGEVLQTKEENLDELVRVVETFRSYKLPLLRQLGVF